MNARERVLAALNREPTDRIPVDIWHTPEVFSALANHFGVQDELELYQVMGLDKIVWSEIAYLTTTDQGEQTRTGSTHFAGQHTMWGVPLRTVNTGVAVYGEFGEPPLRGYDTPESVEGYPFWPDADRFDYDGLTQKLKRASEHFVTNAPWVSLFEIYCQMRGMEQAMLDLITAPALVDAILTQIEARQTEMMKRLFGQAAEHIDLTFISDDMGGQNGPLISLDTWDRFFKDRMKRWCDLIHSYGIKVFYHSDGSCFDLIPRLIEAGIDVLNPIQHVCPGMEMKRLRDSFGGRLVFHGGIDNQHVLPMGTPDEVRIETRNCLQTLGRDGTGYVCCSCHNIQAGTPIENILAMVEETSKA
jgi:uroporphyrinogen decarboxylase